MTEPARAEAATQVLVLRETIAEPARYLATVDGLTEAARHALREALDRPLRDHALVASVAYGRVADDNGDPTEFYPFPCPEATHARVTVRLIEEAQ